MPPQTNITEKRSRIMVVTSHPAALSLTPTSLQKIYVAFSDTFSPNSLASQPTKSRGYPWQAGGQPAPDLW